MKVRAFEKARNINNRVINLNFFIKTVGDELFSISELEHGIIRARMAHPAQFMSRFVIPKSHYRMALQKGDYRINFALNPGSFSSPSKVLLYTPGSLDSQLNDATALYLEQASIVTKGSNTVIAQLPRICQWFIDDFGSDDELLEKISPFLKSYDRAKYTKAKSSGANVSVRFNEFSFKCRPFSLLKK